MEQIERQKLPAIEGKNECLDAGERGITNRLVSNDSCRVVSRGECVEISNVTKFARKIKIEGTVCGLSDALALTQTSAIGLAPQPRHSV